MSVMMNYFFVIKYISKFWQTMFLRDMNLERFPTPEHLGALGAGILEGVGEMARLDVVAHLMAARVGEGGAQCAVEAAARLSLLAKGVQVFGRLHIKASWGDVPENAWRKV
jgi:hypothetical protein